MQRRDFLLAIPPALLSLYILDGKDIFGASKTVLQNTAVYNPHLDVKALLEECEPWLSLSLEDLVALVPPQKGFMFVDCPNCHGGAGSITWNLSLGAKTQCRFCKVIFPNAEYPENETVEVKTPVGGTQLFKLYHDKNGKKYWFEAKRWYVQRDQLSKAAYSLAKLHSVNPVQYADAGHRAAAILERFSTVYPRYIVAYEYPTQPKVFLTNGNKVLGNEKQLKSGADRAAKWSAWAYMDISVPLLLAYDQLAGSNLFNANQRTKVENDLFGGMIRFVAEHGHLPINNMSPTLWRSQVIAANVLRRPEVMDHVLPDIHHMMITGFMYDGFWHEGTVSYHLQTVRGFQNVLSAIPKSILSTDKLTQDISSDVARSLAVTDNFRLPNGHYAALNDTWADRKYRDPITKISEPHLMAGLGYGMLGLGRGKQQLQAHLKFTGRFGHHHYDSLNLLLFASGKELVSDIGYTHNKARPWASSTAAHSTVIVDGQNQARGTAPKYALGNLLLFNAKDAGFEVIEAAAPDAYPGVVSDYKRALITVQADAAQYVVDIFHANGGSRHDWILHGSADDDQQLELTTFEDKPLSLNPIPSLLPSGFDFTPATAEQDYAMIFNGPWAYGHFRDVKEVKSGDAVKATFRFKNQSSKGIQSWVMNQSESTFFTTKSWSVRGVKDQSKLDERMRSSLVVRRETSANRFVAVHVPFEGDAPVQQVTPLPWSEDGVALKIKHSTGIDYVLYHPDETMRSGNIEGQPVQFSGRTALIRIMGKQLHLKMAGGTQLQFGKHVLTGSSPAGQLLSVKENQLKVRGHFNVQPGDVIIVQHGSGFTTPFHVAKIQFQDADTLIETQEPPTLSGEASATLKMLFFPHMELSGPHHVTSNILTTITQLEI